MDLAGCFQLMHRTIAQVAIIITLFGCKFTDGEPSCTLEQLHNCQNAVFEGNLMTVSAGGRCLQKNYAQFTHVCEVINFLPNIGHCCCGLDHGMMALCCRYHNGGHTFRCFEPEDSIVVSKYSRQFYLLLLLLPVTVIVLCITVTAVVLCHRHRHKHNEHNGTCGDIDLPLRSNATCVDGHQCYSSTDLTQCLTSCFDWTQYIVSTDDSEQSNKQLRPTLTSDQCYVEPSAPSLSCPTSAIDELDSRATLQRHLSSDITTTSVTMCCQHCSMCDLHPPPPSYEESQSHPVIPESIPTSVPQQTPPTVTVAAVEQTVA